MTQKRKLIEPLASENSASKRKKFTDSGNSASKRKKFADSRKKFDINEIDFNRTYNLEEFEFIKDHIKDNYPNFEFVNGKLVPVSYSPIVYEAIVHEISRQLGWLIDPLNRIIQVYKRNKNGEPYRRKRPWVYLEGGKHLPGFTLELWPIDDIIAQEINYEDDSSEEEDEEECPYCNASIKGASQMVKHIQNKHN
ncbi:unnamed protein product [Rhizophagus irregularis]|nr:unnamed protein product [Rhizophagus irregularis]